MFVLPLDSVGAVVCVTISFVYEVIRIIAAYILSRPSDELRLLKIQKAEASLEVASIKSVNLEFVRHSLLTRKVIKIEKRMELIQFDHAPKLIKVKNFFRICRVVLYIACGIYLSRTSVVMVNPQAVWPLPVFTKNELVYMSPVAIIFVSGLAFRHIFRTILPIIFRNTVFP